MERQQISTESGLVTLVMWCDAEAQLNAGIVIDIAKTRQANATARITQVVQSRVVKYERQGARRRVISISKPAREIGKCVHTRSIPASNEQCQEMRVTRALKESESCQQMTSEVDRRSQVCE